MDGDGEGAALQEDVAKVLSCLHQSGFVGRLSVVDELLLLLSRQHRVAERQQLEELVTVLQRGENSTLEKNPRAPTKLVCMSSFILK